MDQPLPLNEAERLKALERYAILDSSAEEMFDRITRMAARLFDAPMALISLVDKDRQWFKSCFGIEACQTDRDIAFCTHAILSSEVMVVRDAHQDERFADNPLVSGPPHVRFYAGAPLRTSDGFGLGTLCILAPEPREWSEKESLLLADLACIVVDEFELRSAVEHLKQEVTATPDTDEAPYSRHEHFEPLIEDGGDIITVVREDGTIVYQSPSVARILEYRVDDLIDKNIFDYIHLEDQERVHAAVSELRADPSKKPVVHFRWRHGDSSWHDIESIFRVGRLNPQASEIVLSSRDITENKQVQEELRQAQVTLEARVDERTAELTSINLAMQEAKDQLQAVLDAVPGGVAWISSSLRYLGVNQYLANFLQEPSDGIVGRAVSSFKNTPDFTRFVRDVFVSPARASAQEISITLNGRPCIFLMVAQKYRNGQAAVFVGVDITKRKQVETALQKAEEKYRGIFENAVEGIFQSTPDGRYQSVNPALAHIYGYSSPEEFINSPANVEQTLYVDPARRSELLRLLETHGNVNNFDSQVYRKDGEIIWISESARSIRDDQKTLLYYEGFVDDITARKYAEEILQDSHEELENRVKERTLALTEANDSLRNEVAERLRIDSALRQSEARKSAILEASLDCIISIDHEGKVTEWNPACETNLGYSRAEALGRFLGELIVPPVLRDPQCFNLQRDFNSSNGLRLDERIEVPAVRADGSELTAEISIVLTPIAGPAQYTVFLQDITARKRADEAVRQAKAEAEAANRAKSEFLSRMSHELRTPLNGILGFAQVLQMDFSSGMHRDIVDDIFKAGKHLLALINEVLDISRIESGHLSLSLEPVPLYDLVQENLDLVSALAWDREIHIRNEVAANANEHLFADRQRLAQCLLNLLSNAIKYNKQKGSIIITCRTEENGRVRLEVSDTGYGIAEEKVGQIFTPFERLGAEHTDIEGTGLGLALTKRLMESMGGSIGVRSEKDRGSSFWLELPRANAPDESIGEQEVSPAETPIPTKQNVVLYIEDNLANFKVIELVLTHRPNIKLLAAMQGSIGLELAAQHQPDMLLLDLNLPDMHGTEVLRRLRENPETQRIPVVVLSADATPGQITRVLEDGAKVYLTKPLDVQLFLKVLDETLAD